MLSQTQTQRAWTSQGKRTKIKAKSLRQILTSQKKNKTTQGFKAYFQNTTKETKGKSYISGTSNIYEGLKMFENGGFNKKKQESITDLFH